MLKKCAKMGMLFCYFFFFTLMCEPVFGIRRLWQISTHALGPGTLANISGSSISFWAPRYTVMPVILLLAFWALIGEQRILVTTEASIETEKLPEGTPPLKIALVSDLHIGSPQWGIDRLRGLVSRVNAEHPDMILLLGDFLISNVIGGSFVEPDEFAPIIKKFTAPLGVYSVFGNHDWIDGPETMSAAFSANNLTVLEAQAADVSWYNTPIRVIGIPDDATRRPDVKTIIDSLYPADDRTLTLLVSHNPAVYLDLKAETRVDLMTAGHTHGGQVDIPFADPIFLPTRAPFEWAYGLIKTENGPMFVSSGVGTSVFPIRFNQPPEIVMLTLEPKKLNTYE